MTIYQRVLLAGPATGFYKIRKYNISRYFGPVDLGICRFHRGWSVKGSSHLPTRRYSIPAVR